MRELLLSVFWQAIGDDGLDLEAFADGSVHLENKYGQAVVFRVEDLDAIIAALQAARKKLRERYVQSASR